MAPVMRGTSDHDAVGATLLGGPAPPGASGPETTDSTFIGVRHGIWVYAPGGGGAHRVWATLAQLVDSSSHCSYPTGAYQSSVARQRRHRAVDVYIRQHSTLLPLGLFF